MTQRRFGLPILLAATLALGLSAPAAGYQIIQDQGPRGSFVLQDTSSRPAGRCGYGSPNASSVAALQWVRVKAPRVFAADRSPQRDHRKVSWRIYVQRMQPSGPWTTIATSPVQKRTAYEEEAAAFTAMKVSFTGRRDQSNVRALVLLKWLRPDGSVEARVKLSIDNYSVDWTVGDPAYVFTGGSCWSAAD